MQRDQGLDGRMIDTPSQAGMIDVVIVNWNSGGDLARCIAALAGNAGAGLLAHIIVVDNGSGDGSAQVTGDGAVPLTIDRAGRNLGFAAASNRGAAQGKAPYILFLNPDTEIHDGALAAALQDFGPDIGLVGLRLLDAAGRTQRGCSRFPTALGFWLRALGLDRLSGFAAYAPFMQDWPHEDSRRVDQLMGACLLMPRELFAALAGFDERFFLYYEDVDLALRALRHGRGSWFEARGTVTHIGGGSSRRVPARRLSLSLASRLAYARKHFGIGGFVSVVLCTLLVEPWTRLAFAALRHGPGAAGAVIAGYALLLKPGSARP
jgi:N-acetylglucosaminyl-diphospho-decaprenol L-rhamnosyltransferase